MKRFSSKRLARRALLLLAELTVVIVGVYVAFRLNEWREAREEREQRRQLLVALQEELQNVGTEIDELDKWYGQKYSNFKRAYETGERPLPEPVYLSIAFEPYVFRAAMENGGVELVDAGLMYDLADFYNTLDWIFLHLKKLEDFSEDQLSPALANGATTDHFYNDEDRLKRGYRWYNAYNGRLMRLTQDLTQRADSLNQELTKRLRTLED